MKKLNTRVTGHCQMYVEGVTMRCPLCGVVVTSGQMHECKTVEAVKPPKKAKRIR